MLATGGGSTVLATKSCSSSTVPAIGSCGGSTMLASMSEVAVQCQRTCLR